MGCSDLALQAGVIVPNVCVIFGVEWLRGGSPQLKMSQTRARRHNLTKPTFVG